MKVLSQVEGCTALLLKTAARNHKKLIIHLTKTMSLLVHFYHSFTIIKSHSKNKLKTAYAIKLITTLTVYFSASKQIFTDESLRYINHYWAKKALSLKAELNSINLKQKKSPFTDLFNDHFYD
ncbi:hypothetical protein [Colwellia sp. C1TZA3]|uniref:hypothetical protein n=1 Tax=Colwellia sp. C1TZA3 TaxID=2508879 RepID=UPI0011B9F9DD|nr:hypothetical protein [Colwellia sp. C1TZA3]TWX70188.1 hypothetical protein ESZ39_10480 [Colwellia sp. C1TZA3]